MAGLPVKTLSSSEAAAEDERQARRVAHAVLTQPGMAPYRHCTLDNFDPDPDATALRRTREWVHVVRRFMDATREGKHFKIAPQLFLTSERAGEEVAPGSGKSHLTAAALRALAEAGYGRVHTHERSGEQWPSLVFVSAVELLAEIRNTYNRGSEKTAAEVVARYVGADVLVLDDVGTETGGDDATMQFFRLLDRRILRPTAYTSNYSPKQLRERSPEWAKLVSRMQSGMRGAVLHGPDRRRSEEANPWAMFEEEA